MRSLVASRPHLHFFRVAALGIALSSAVTSPFAIGAETYAFTTFSGAPGFGTNDGPATSARFGLPQGIVVDALGNIYLSDYANACIRKVTPSGTVSTLAGIPALPGFSDGTGSAARFNAVFGMCPDGLGGLMVADSGNSAIRWVRQSGSVLTMAGYAGSGFADGSVVTAKFANPNGVAVDASGNIFVADTGNHLIRKIDLTATVSTIAGATGVSGSTDGPGATARFNKPSRIAVDSTGTLYVSDSGNHTIRKITPAGGCEHARGLSRDLRHRRRHWIRRSLQYAL